MPAEWEASEHGEWMQRLVWVFLCARCQWHCICVFSILIFLEIIVCYFCVLEFVHVVSLEEDNMPTPWSLTREGERAKRACERHWYSVTSNICH